MAGDVIERRKGETIFCVNKNLEMCSSQKQRYVSLSSCKAEVMAAMTVTCQAIWICH